MSIYLFWGQEDFTLEKKLQELKKKFVVPEFASMSYKTFSNPEYSELVEILCTPPFMFGSVFIVINCENYLGSGKKETSFSDNELKKLDEIMANLNENIHVVFVYKIPRDSTKKIDTRKKLYKLISKYAKVEEFPQFKTYDKALLTQVKNFAAKKELVFSDDCSKFLIEICGANLRILDSELEKIKLSIYPKTKVTIQDIKSICNPTEDVFKIIDFYLQNKRDVALDELRKLNEKQHILITLATLITNVKNLLSVKLLSETMTPMQISKETGMHEYRIKLQLEKLENISVEKLVDLKNKLTEAEFEIKSGGLQELSLEKALI